MNRSNLPLLLGTSTLDLCTNTKRLLLFVTLVFVTLFASSIDRFIVCGHCHSKSNLMGVAADKEVASMRRILLLLAVAANWK